MTDKTYDTVGPGASKLSRVILEAVDERAAFAVAERIARRTGRTVTVRNENGVPLATFRGAIKN
jgi:hypothetical protein